VDVDDIDDSGDDVADDDVPQQVVMLSYQPQCWWRPY
jgi:hypothetical protein